MQKHLKGTLGVLTAFTLALSLASCSAASPSEPASKNADQVQIENSQGERGLKESQNVLEGDSFKDALGSSYSILPPGYEGADKGWSIALGSDYSAEGTLAVDDMVIAYDSRPIIGSGINEAVTTSVIIMDARNGAVLYEGGFESVLKADESDGAEDRVSLTKVGNKNFLNIVEIETPQFVDGVSTIHHHSMDLSSGKFEFKSDQKKIKQSRATIETSVGYTYIYSDGELFLPVGDQLLEGKADAQDSLVGTSKGEALRHSSSGVNDIEKTASLSTESGWSTSEIAPNAEDVVWVKNNFALISEPSGDSRVELTYYLIDLETRELITSINSEEDGITFHSDTKTHISDNGEFIAHGDTIINTKSKSVKSYNPNDFPDFSFTAVSNKGVGFGIDWVSSDEEEGGSAHLTIDQDGSLNSILADTENGEIAYPVSYVASDGTLFFSINSLGVNKP